MDVIHHSPTRDPQAPACDKLADIEHAARIRLLYERTTDWPAVAEQQLAEADAPTGVLRQRPGLAALRRELDRAQRTDGALTTVAIDVDGVKGHGDHDDDTLHNSVAVALLCNMRSYDLVIRLGDAQFLCALCGVTITNARARFGAVQRALARSSITISVGYAELAAYDTPSTLIGRASADLQTARTSTRRTPRRAPS